MSEFFVASYFMDWATNIEVTDGLDEDEEIPNHACSIGQGSLLWILKIEIRQREKRREEMCVNKRDERERERHWR